MWNGPPLVSMKTMSKPLRVLMTARAMTTTVAGRSRGTMIRRNCCQPLAPSMEAASSRSLGIVVSAAR